jgi:hypothetical protein
MKGLGRRTYRRSLSLRIKIDVIVFRGIFVTSTVNIQADLPTQTPASRGSNSPCPVLRHEDDGQNANGR